MLFLHVIGLDELAVTLQQTQGMRDAPVTVECFFVRFDLIEREKVSVLINLNVVECPLAESGDVDHALLVNRVAQKLMMLARIIKVLLWHVVSAVSVRLVETLHLCHYEGRGQHLVRADKGIESFQ